VFFHWLNNLKDWNISRQISWGIQLPVWYCQDQNNEKCKSHNGIIVNIKNKPSKCPYCGSKHLVQDPDVLDTWFSSGQWPFATLTTNKKKDFRTFYPTDVMETGWDILFFWVARMIMLGIYQTGKVPFRTVYLHGLVRDKDRQKMSKSKGNAIDPLAVTELYGTDALRMALIIGNTAGNDIIISEEKIRGYRNFANKIWNASRFILMNLEDFDGKKPILKSHDKQILKNLEKKEKKIAFYLDNFRFSLAGETLYHYFWHTFADKIIEEMKVRIKDGKEKKAAQYLLWKILNDSLKMLHPFMPFVTEAIWQKLPKQNKEEKILMITQWP
jgi:valyl-tRNA synthetase